MEFNGFLAETGTMARLILVETLPQLSLLLTRSIVALLCPPCGFYALRTVAPGHGSVGLIDRWAYPPRRSSGDRVVPTDAIDAPTKLPLPDPLDPLGRSTWDKPTVGVLVDYSPAHATKLYMRPYKWDIYMSPGAQVHIYIV